MLAPVLRGLDNIGFGVTPMAPAFDVSITLWGTKNMGGGCYKMTTKLWHRF